jgi:hypothetical protein
MKLITVFFLMLFSFSALAEKEKIIYQYKKYQKFDFENLEIEGESGGPGDLSIDRRFQYQFKNKLPYRKNFNPEIRKSIERVR